MQGRIKGGWKVWEFEGERGGGMRDGGGKESLSTTGQYQHAHDARHTRNLISCRDEQSSQGRETARMHKGNP